MAHWTNMVESPPFHGGIYGFESRMRLQEAKLSVYRAPQW